MTARDLIYELRAFARGAPASPTRDALLAKTDAFIKTQKTKARKVRGYAQPPDHLPGIVAAVQYLLEVGRVVHPVQFFSSIKTRNTTLNQKP